MEESEEVMEEVEMEEENERMKKEGMGGNEGGG